MLEPHHSLMALDDLRFNLRRTCELATAPHVLLRPKVSVDGDQWCFLYGENLHDGVAGFGDTPELAAADFDKSWRECRLPTPRKPGDA